jgi:hypothetical protein
MAGAGIIDHELLLARVAGGPVAFANCQHEFGLGAGMICLPQRTSQTINRVRKMTILD